MLAFTGIPLFFLELALGQFASEGPITVWKLAPLFKGIGWAMVVVSGLVGIYYNVIIAWTIFYFVASLTSKLPWMDCQNPWNTPACKEAGINCTNAIGSQSPSEQYWERHVLGLTDGLENMGIIRWKLALCLLGAWVVIFLCLIKGVKSSGKVVYFTATFPYIVLVILLVRGVTLPGAKKGIMFYVTPDFNKLKDSKVWADAATQIFYSLGVGFGGLEVMSSYNKFKNNCYRDALLVSIINCMTSVFAGFVIFSVMGFMSEKMAVPVAQVAKSGPGLAFVAYPEGIAQMPIAPLWSVLFFLMLFTLGLDSQFAMMETVISAISDEFLVLRKYKMLFTGFLCVLLFLLGLPCVMDGGMYIFNLIDSYSGGYSLMVIALVEVIVISWIYGYKKFAADIKMMIGFTPNIYWRITWQFLTPAIIVFILVFSAIKATPLSLGSYLYPCWAQMLGITMVFASIVFIPLMMGIETCKHFGCKKTLKIMVSPTPDWGPAEPEYRTGKYAIDRQRSRDPIPAKSNDIQLQKRPSDGATNQGYVPDGDFAHF
ncbi:sodium-dependent proline transporter-like [Tubulanus polymorphus]|uniref:sodium-dependent proline transporter-like n=1 Tax=Tubulanus polymorphus TaxID=672921 RepID=UPI003DA34199